MGFYSRFILPRALHFACSLEPLRRQRQKVVPRAKGVVLEVGIGSGLNLPHYDASKVTRVLGLDPAAELTKMARKAAAKVPFEVELVRLPGEEIPLADASVDSIVITYTLCTIDEPVAALRQMARVLKPGGEIHYCEHGAAPDVGVQRWQRRLGPVWTSLAGGCRLDRDIPTLLRDAGLDVSESYESYIPGWRPASYNYWGVASLGVKSSPDVSPPKRPAKT